MGPDKRKPQFRMWDLARFACSGCKRLRNWRRLVRWNIGTIGLPCLIFLRKSHVLAISKGFKAPVPVATSRLRRQTQSTKL